MTMNEGEWGRERWAMDPERGDDLTGDGTPQKPMRTIAAVKCRVDALIARGRVLEEVEIMVGPRVDLLGGSFVARERTTDSKSVDCKIYETPVMAARRWLADHFSDSAEEQVRSLTSLLSVSRLEGAMVQAARSTQRARLDTEGAARPMTEILGVYPAGKKNFYSNAEELLVRSVGVDRDDAMRLWQIACPGARRMSLSFADELRDLKSRVRRDAVEACARECEASFACPLGLSGSKVGEP